MACEDLLILGPQPVGSPPKQLELGWGRNLQSGSLENRPDLAQGEPLLEFVQGCLNVDVLSKPPGGRALRMYGNIVSAAANTSALKNEEVGHSSRGRVRNIFGEGMINILRRREGRSTNFAIVPLGCHNDIGFWDWPRGSWISLRSARVSLLGAG